MSEYMRKIPLVVLLTTALSAQTFSAAPVDPWPAVQDASPGTVLRWTFSVQPDTVLRRSINGVPQSFTLVHFTAHNTSGAPAQVSVAQLYEAAVYARFAYIGSEAAALIGREQPKGGVKRALGQIVLWSPSLTSSLAAGKILKGATLQDPRFQLGMLALQGGVVLLKGRYAGQDTRAAVASTRIVQEADSEGRPVVKSLEPGDYWMSYFGASEVPPMRALVIDQFSNGTLSVFSATR